MLCKILIYSWLLDLNRTESSVTGREIVILYDLVWLFQIAKKKKNRSQSIPKCRFFFFFGGGVEHAVLWKLFFDMRTLSILNKYTSLMDARTYTLILYVLDNSGLDFEYMYIDCRSTPGSTCTLSVSVWICTRVKISLHCLFVVGCMASWREKNDNFPCLRKSKKMHVSLSLAYILIS